MFCSILQKPNNKGIIKLLRSVEVLRSLNIGQLQRLADTLSTVSFADGEHAIQQGNAGDEFFIITQGNVRLFPHQGFGYEKGAFRRGGERPFFVLGCCLRRWCAQWRRATRMPRTRR